VAFSIFRVSEMEVQLSRCDGVVGSSAGNLECAAIVHTYRCSCLVPALIAKV
jgi:hypothetical protein